MNSSFENRIENTRVCSKGKTDSVIVTFVSMWMSLCACVCTGWMENVFLIVRQNLNK